MNLTALTGAFAYEYRMQIRRRVVWLTLAGFAGALMALTLSTSTWHTYSRERTALLGDADVASLVMLLMPIAVGILLADRLPRDRVTRVAEVLATLPVPLGWRLLGKYLGATLATLTPIFILYWLGVGYVTVLRGGNAASLPLALLPFMAIVLPGCLFVAAFAIACTAWLWPPIFQFLLVGYWFWGNLLQSHSIPTLNGTLLTANGDYMLVGFFGGDGTLVQHATALQGMLSLGLLLSLSALALAVAWSYLNVQQAHRTRRKPSSMLRLTQRGLGLPYTQ
jgi:ABC-2 type transport system permease protein